MKSLNGFGKIILCKNVPFHNVFNFTCFSDTSLLFFASYTQEKTRLTQPKVSFIILGEYDKSFQSPGGIYGKRNCSGHRKKQDSRNPKFHLFVRVGTI